jgi:hypothetical protein
MTWHPGAERGGPPAWVSDEPAVERYAIQLLGQRSIPEVIDELNERIDAHPDSDGYCGNGCNTGGWLLPYPCPTRRFYEAVREYLWAGNRPER